MIKIKITESQLDVLNSIKPTIKAVIFDFDYTLFDTSAAQESRSVAKKTKGTQKEKTAAWVEASKSADKCVAYNGIKELISFLFENNIQCCIVTMCNAIFVKAVLDANGFPNIPIFSCHKVFRPKNKCMVTFSNNLGINPEECISIGDRASDAKESDKANIPFIGCSWGNGEDSDRITNGYKSPLDVIKYIERVNENVR